MMAGIMLDHITSGNSWSIRYILTKSFCNKEALETVMSYGEEGIAKIG